VPRRRDRRDRRIKSLESYGASLIAGEFEEKKNPRKDEKSLENPRVLTGTFNETKFPINFSCSCRFVVARAKREIDKAIVALSIRPARGSLDRQYSEERLSNEQRIPLSRNNRRRYIVRADATAAGIFPDL